MYDDELSDPYDYHDLFQIMPTVNHTYQLLVECKECSDYQLGQQVAGDLLTLKVHVHDEDETSDEQFYQLDDLRESSLINFYPKDVLTLAAYFTYMTTPLKQRPQKLFQLLNQYDDFGQPKLEGIMQVGNELPQLDQFLNLLIHYLGNKRSQLAEELLNEALKLTGNENQLTIARQYVKTQPGLIKKYLQTHLKSALQSSPASQQLLTIGQEAVNQINPKYIIRGEIALIMVQLAQKAGDQKATDQALFIAFESMTTVNNYLNLYLHCHQLTRYQKRIDQIISQANQHPQDYQEYPWSDVQDDERSQNVVDKITANLLHFRQGDFAVVTKQLDKSVKNEFTKTTDCKTYLAVCLLTLNEQQTLSETTRGLVNILSLAQKGKLWPPFYKWQQSMNISKQTEIKLVKKLEDIISQSVDQVMKYNQRKRYSDCAFFIAALGETETVLHLARSKQSVMQKYQSKYPRRTAFRRELRKEGL